MKLIYELGRKLFHISWFFAFWLYLFIDKKYGSVALLFPFFLFLFFLAIDIIRLKHIFWIPFFNHLLRISDKKGFFTPTTTMLGILVSAILFDKAIVFVSVSMMVFGDTAAAFIGRTSSKPIFGKKTLRGFFACLITSLFAGYAILPSFGIIVLMAVATSLTELFAAKNDNLLMLLISGLVGQIIF